MSLKPKAIIFLKKTLGEDGYEKLVKSDLYKKKTATALDIREISTALQIVPRTILSFLHKELKDMKDGSNKEIKLPVDSEAFLSVTKYSNDVYSGEIRQKGEIVATYRYRSLPGVGLVIMSTFELYDVMDLGRMGGDHQDTSKTSADDIQKIIEEKLSLRDTISSLVDRKISEREALDSLIRSRLTATISESGQGKEKEEMKKDQENDKKKPLKLKEFLDKKSEKNKHFVKLEKSDIVSCPDCQNVIFNESGFSGCICYGADMDGKIHIKKSEGGVQLSFPKNWDKENVEMLLHALRESKNRSSK